MRSLDGLTILQTFQPIEMQMDLGVARRSGSFAVLGVDGAINPYGAGAAPLAAHNFAWTFRTTAKDKRSFDSHRDELVRTIMHGRPQTLVYKADDGTLRFNIGTFLSAPTIVSPDSTYRHDYQIVWELDDPYWRSQYPADVLVYGATGKNYGDVTLPPYGSTSFSLGTNPTAHTVDATGTVPLGVPSAPDKGPVIQIVGPYGGSGGVTVYNDAVQFATGGGTVPMQLTITEPIPAGVHYVVDCGAKSVRKDGQPAYGHFSVPLYQDDWMRIEPNQTNPFRFVPLGTGVLTGGRATIIYYLKWL